MNRMARVTARRKIEAESDFGRRCAEAFYTDLFATLPGARELFTDPRRAQRMFGLMVDLLTATIGDEDALNAQLDTLGHRHRMLGIQPMHLRIGRRAFLEAVSRTCPSLTEEEIQLFGFMFDRMTDAMNGDRSAPRTRRAT